VLVAALVAAAVLLPLLWVLTVIRFAEVRSEGLTAGDWLGYWVWALPPAIAVLGWLIRRSVEAGTGHRLSLPRACVAAAAGLAPVFAAQVIVTMRQYGYDYAVSLGCLALSLAAMVALTAAFVRDD
jgi:hypothetical protein